MDTEPHYVALAGLKFMEIIDLPLSPEYKGIYYYYTWYIF